MPAQPIANMIMDNEAEKMRPAASYADEVMCANWHPLVLLLAEPLARAQKSALNVVEAEDFLDRLYTCQRA